MVQVGPTYLGTFHAAGDVAVRLFGDYNGALQSLTNESENLGKAIQGIRYMADNFDKVETTNAAGIAAILANPPYQPGDPGPGRRTGGRGH